MPKTVVLKHGAQAGMLAAVFVALTLFMTACNVVSDRQLRGVFDTNREDFGQLIQLAEADRSIASIPALDKEPADISMPTERWRRYQELFEKLGIRCGLTRRAAAPNAVFFCAECQGSAISRDCKGYVYVERAPTSLNRDLDGPAPGLHFEPLNGSWYLFRDGG